MIPPDTPISVQAWISEGLEILRKLISGEGGQISMGSGLNALTCSIIPLLMHIDLFKTIS